MAHQSPPSRGVGGVVGVGLAAALILGGCSDDVVSAPLAPSGNGQLTPLLDSTLSPPRWFTGSNAKVHLVYELMLTNVIPAPISLTSLDVRAADTDALLMHLTGDALRSATSLPTAPDTPTLDLPPASTGIVWLDIPLGGSDAVPTAVKHTVSIAPAPGVQLPGIPLSYTGAATQVDRRKPVVLSPPLAGPQWAALGSCCDGPHRRALYPIDGRWYLGQRFAIDFNKLEPDNRPGVGDPSLPGSFPTFGQQVHAVADGTIVVAEDHDPDLKVGEHRDDPTPDNAGGNRVIIDIGDGRFAVYAHLKSTSVRVKAGEAVTRGQHIADVGSSGTSGGPHLHFQVTDRPSVVFGDGMPYVFNTFDVTGRTPPLADALPYYDSLAPIPIISKGDRPCHDELPLSGDVVAFPAM